MIERRPFSQWEALLACEFVEAQEGRRLKAYRCSAGVATIGVGHTSGVKIGDVCTDAQATQWLIDDLDRVAKTLAKKIVVDVTEGQYIALLSLAFNIGTSGVLNGCPKLMRKLNAGDFEGAANEFLDCCYANGRRIEGLANRREREVQLFLGG